MRNSVEDWDTYEDDSWQQEPSGIESAELFEPTNEEEYAFEGDEFFDDIILDIDYSMLKGDFKSSFSKVKYKTKRTRKPRKIRKPLDKDFEVQDKQHALISGGRKQINKVIVPQGREVIVEGVDKFILSNAPEKNIGYYKGEKLKELVLIMNNTSGVDFNLELFNPSMPVDYLQSTSGNLNDRIIVAGQSNISYSDVLFNLLANPTLIANARLVVTGAQVGLQKQQNLVFKNKAIDGAININSLNLNLNQDLFQYQTDIILFDILAELNRVYIPDGMDVMQYKVLAGNTVTFCFYYKQKSLKKLLWKEARKKSKVLGEVVEVL